MAAVASAPKQKSQSTWALAWRRFKKHKAAMVSLGVVIALVLMAIFAPWIAPIALLHSRPETIWPTIIFKALPENTCLELMSWGATCFRALFTGPAFHFWWVLWLLLQPPYWEPPWG